MATDVDLFLVLCGLTAVYAVVLAYGFVSGTLEPLVRLLGVVVLATTVATIVRGRTQWDASDVLH